MNDYRQLLALGNFSGPERGRVTAIGQESAFDVHFASDPHAASSWLDAHETQALLLDGESDEAQHFAIERRAESRHATLPLLSMAKSVSDLCFIEAFSWGVDDVVNRHDADPLRARLRNLPRGPMSFFEASRGAVLVAESDRSRRLLVGRVLRNAGYEVTFAVQSTDLTDFASTKKYQVIVASTSLCEEPRELVSGLRAKGEQSLFVLTCPPRELKKFKAALDGFDGATTTDAFAPAENVLFVSNELGRPRGQDLRASARVPYGTTVGFRCMGRDRDDHGYTYNVSEGGLYVRTLAPPDEPLVWLELCPPRSERRVRLVGKVAWRRGLTKGQYATVPPGFGVEIVDGARMDIACWQEGCRAYESLVD